MNDALDHWFEKAKLKREERKKTFSARRPALLETLRAMVLTDELKNPIVLEYEGYGDNGGFEETPDDLPDEIEDFLWDLLVQEEGGWENNNGGRGEIKWDVNTDEITIDHTQYVTSSEFRQYKY